MIKDLKLENAVFIDKMNHVRLHNDEGEFYKE